MIITIKQFSVRGRASIPIRVSREGMALARRLHGRFYSKVNQLGLCTFLASQTGGIVALIDAGSTKTKLHVFEWESSGADQELPTMWEKDSIKVSVPLASLADTPENVGSEILQPLIDFLKEVVVSPELTPLFLKGTLCILLAFLGLSLLTVEPLLRPLTHPKTEFSFAKTHPREKSFDPLTLHRSE